MRPGSCPRQPPSLPVPSGSVRQPIAAALPVVLALILLPPLAFASPPDPSWVAGFYDGADGDDIVSLIYETSAATTAASAYVGLPPCLLDISFAGVSANVPDLHFSCDPRSPPIPWPQDLTYVFNSLPPPTSHRDVPVTLSSLAEFRLSRRDELSALRVVTKLTLQVQQPFILA